jgi:predicted transcriptional regulator
MAHSSATMTVRLDRETRLRLERLARATSRSKAFLAQEAIRSYLELHEWQVASIEEGIRAADAGEVIEHEDVKAWLSSWGRARERRPPR